MVRRLLALAAVACGIVVTDAACNNNCNGHGTCSAYDKCSCHAAFSFATDCSLRTCPYERTRGRITSSTTNTAFEVHGYEECAGNGRCNRKTGECECNDGFTGSACQRATCPDDCSGHGQCQTIEIFNSGYATPWDAERTNVCQCDPGYEGYNCARRMCPRGDDPLTPGTGSQVDEVQTCIITASSTISGKFTILFTDWTGQVHETRPLNSASFTALNIQEEFKRLPNNVAPTVGASVSGLSSAAVTFTVTFNHEDNSGTQTLLALNIDDDSTTGHQPLRAAIAGGGSEAFTCTKTTAGTEENAVCSGRGTCNSETGLCECHRGFKGSKCSSQTFLT